MLVVLTGLFDDFPQIVTGHEVHDQIFAIAVCEVVRDFRQIGMIEPGQHLGLAPKLLSQLLERLRRNVDVTGRDLLDGADPTSKEEIFRSIDGAHATAADGADDAVTVFESNTGFQKLCHGKQMIRRLIKKSSNHTTMWSDL